jgi:hypothetical protein
VLLLLLLQSALHWVSSSHTTCIWLNQIFASMEASVYNRQVHDMLHDVTAATAVEA